MIRLPGERPLSMSISEPVAAIRKAKFAARALYVGERIDLRSFAKSSRVIAQKPVTVPIDGGGIVVVYRYGACVFFDTTAVDQERFLAALGPIVKQPYKRPENEEVLICVSAEKKEGMEGGTTVILKDTSVERLQVVAAGSANRSRLRNTKRTLPRLSITLSRSHRNLRRRGGSAETSVSCCVTLAALSRTNTRWWPASK